VKVFISFDMEGVAGIVDWSQCRAPGQPYEEGRPLLLGEVNAAIDGAMAVGATEIVCNDSHGTMSNLDPAALYGHARRTRSSRPPNGSWSRNPSPGSARSAGIRRWPRR